MSEKYLGIEKPLLIELGGLITAKEIAGQPQLWGKVYNEIISQKDIIQDFLKKNIKTNTKIILTGAGTSAFIGNVLQGSYNKNFKTDSVAIATTDLITHPQDYLVPDAHHLVVSFARSGDSPESVGAVEKPQCNFYWASLGLAGDQAEDPSRTAH